MAVTPAKENILRKIRQALVARCLNPSLHSEGAQSVFKTKYRRRYHCFRRRIPHKAVRQVCILQR